jgi:plastocyanin
MRNHILTNTAVAAVLALTFAACGSSPTSPGGNNSGNDGAIAATITIDATGNATPKDVTVAAGSRVTFVNNHSASHQMASDPHPEHTLCPSLNTVGLLTPGQSRTSSNLNTPMVCTYHDHINDGDARLKGTIRVQ